MIECGRPPIAMVLVELKGPSAAITLSRLRAVVASLTSKDCAMPNHDAHSAVAINKRRATEIIKVTVLDENRLLAAPSRTISPRVIAVIADAFPGRMANVDTTNPRAHGEIAVVDNTPSPTEKYDGT